MKVEEVTTKKWTVKRMERKEKLGSNKKTNKNFETIIAIFKSDTNNLDFLNKIQDDN